MLLPSTYFNQKKSGCPRKITRDDHILKSIVSQSPVSSYKNVWVALLLKGTDESRKAVSCRLVNGFQLRSCKPAWKPILTVEMKRSAWHSPKEAWALDRETMGKHYVLWWIQSLLHISIMSESPSTSGKRYDEKYNRQTMKHPPS